VAVTLTLLVSAPTPWFRLSGFIEKLQDLGLIVMVNLKEPKTTQVSLVCWPVSGADPSAIWGKREVGRL
jgi:hypothetical protein